MSTLPSNPLPTMNDLLRRELRFTDADLALNREGRLSEAQALLLRNKHDEATCQAVGCGATIAFIAILFGIAVILGAKVASGPLVLLESVFLAVVFFTMLARKSAFNQDSTQLKVTAITGPIKRQYGQGRRIAWFIILDTKRFEISPHLYEALEKGGIFTLYYAPISETLLSAEYVGPKSA